MDASREFFIRADETEKRLFVSRPSANPSGVLSPCSMTPDDVDYEMERGKHPEILEITGMNQKSLEHFALHYAKNYRFLCFSKCQLIQDFSPLEDLPKLESFQLNWNIRADRLWNFERNQALHTIRIIDAKRMTLRPALMQTSRTLENVLFFGSYFSPYPMETLDCFAGMPALKRLGIHYIRLKDKGMDVLKTLPSLERFDFDAGMLTTEEIAWIVAKHPGLSGKCLCAYNREDAVLTDVRVCGSRKPGLNLPKDQKRLDGYVARFNELVEQYRNEA